jgi:hypothetical protein
MDTLLCNDDGDIIFFGAPSATDEILAFHYGNFDNAYGDGTVGAAAANGRVYADTVPATLPAEFGSIGTPTTASGQTTYTWAPPATSLQANVLLVAGGGSGGSGGTANGGGGAGGIIYNQNLSLSGTTEIIVGGGGGRSIGLGNDGYNSKFSSLIAIGGGGGGTHKAGTNSAGRNGGSGGGAGTDFSARNGGTGVPGQGNNGGANATLTRGGGGGGAGEVGQNATSTINGKGGAGFLGSVFGETYGENGWFAGGGGGGGTGGSGQGGIGGGGAGAINGSSSGFNAQMHTGGGGGGCRSGSTNELSGSGGSGVVLVRYIVDTTVITNEETLAFLYAGSGTETTYTWDAEGVTYADVLIVGGGGGGTTSSGFSPRGGGGGGEVVFRQGVAVTPGVEIKVGRGGPASTQGGISQFTSSIQANGGGSGGSGSGGSGGGANRGVTTGGASVKLGGGMGNVGGHTTSSGAGGGGGATEAGAIGNSGAGTNGGEGYAATVFGVWNTVYGSGGGGGARSGGGGLGGTNAGNGGNSSTSKNGILGVAHTGSAGGGAGANNGGGTGGSGGSGIVLIKPNPGALDGLGTTIYTQAVGAYALRRLFGAYTGAHVRLRRSTDNVEVDVTFDKYGYPVNFDVEGWLGAATGYVTTWYDQSGEDNDLTQTNVTYQPKYDSRNKRVNLNNAYMTIPGSDNVAPFSTNQPTLVQRTSMVSFKAPSNLASNQAKNVYAKGLATSTGRSDTRVWWYQDGNKLGSQHGDGLGTSPVGAYTSEEVVVYSIVEENSSSSVNATSHVLTQNGVRQSGSVVSSSRTFITEPNDYPWGIGYGNGGSSRWNVDAYINEHIIFNTTLNDSVRVAVENEMQYHAIKNF